MPKSKRGQNGIQVIARAAEILRLCRDQPAGSSLGEIAERADLPRSTVQRIVVALAAEGFLIADGDAHGVRLGPALLGLADSARRDVVEIVHPHLKRLSAATGETVDLALFRRDHLVFVDQIAGSQRLRTVSAVGERFPLHSTANGKAVLALLPDARIERLCQGGLKPTTKKSATSAGTVLDQVYEARALGFAIDREEHSPGISAVGVAFEDAAGAIYAISVPMPTHRFKSRHKKIGAALLAMLRDIRRELDASL